MTPDCSLFKMLLIHLVLATSLSLLQGASEVNGDTTASEEESSLEKCCELGSSWAQQKLRCEKFTGPVSGVAPAEQPACLEAVEICCRKIFLENECDQGKADARAGLECSRSDVGSTRRAPAGLGDFRRDCCEGCKLGIMTSLKGKGCSFKRLVLGAPWDSAFTDCCTEAVSSSTQPTTLTKTSSISTSSTTTEVDELDYDDITDPTLNASSSVDLCKIMKGLLCSEICVPTPGSYICKCHEGSKLQPDGRTCVSKTTTTVATTVTTPQKKATTPQKKATTLKKFKSTSVISTPVKPKTTKEQKKITKRSTLQTTVKPTIKKSATTKKSIKTTKSVATTPKKNPTKSRTTRSASSENIDLRSPCPNGYRFNSSTDACDDINECTELTNVCPQVDTICINTLGGFKCKNINEYQQPNYDFNLTDDTRSNDYDGVEEGRAIICAHGLRFNATVKRCDDINECELNLQACAPGEVCRNTLGGYDCIPTGCPRGFTLVNELCLDVDECEQGLHSCAPHERCQNTNGSFTCELPRPTRPPPTDKPTSIACRKGYKVDSESNSCVDVDECVEGPGCRDHERCRNLEGSYDCSPLCGPGWYFQFQTKTCEDVDECLLGHHNCRQRTHYCRNTNGSYSCELLSPCAPGYRRNQEGNCVDVDECLEQQHSCSRASHRYCVNREGGYECITRLPSCPRGFEYSLLAHGCQDVDECRTGRAACETGFGQRCVNLPGSYRCEGPLPDLRNLAHKQKPACPTGYSYDPALRKCSGKKSDGEDDDKTVVTTEG